MLIQELPCLDSNIAGQLLLIEFCNKIGPYVEKGCPLKCRQLEDKRTSPWHRKSDVHDPC
jgi:hypothetical protein